jgi:hypothetical protein
MQELVLTFQTLELLRRHALVVLAL